MTETAFRFVPTNTQQGANVKPSKKAAPRLAEPEHDPLEDEDTGTAEVLSDTPLADALVDYEMAKQALAEAQAQLADAEAAIKLAIMEPGFTYGEKIGTGRKARHLLVTWSIEERKRVSAKKLRAYFEQYPKRGAYEDFLRHDSVEMLEVREVDEDEYAEALGE